MIVMGMCAQAQFYFSCTHREYYVYDVETEDFTYLNGYDENSMFKLNENLTMFEHTTPDISSTYYVSKSEYDEEEGTLSLDVVSDVGNKYFYTFDVDREKIRVLYTRDDSIYLLVFTIKKYWTED